MGKHRLGFLSMDHITPEQRALRALRDCGVIRVRYTGLHPGYVALVRRNAIDYTVSDTEKAFDFRLNSLGQALAAKLPRFPGDNARWGLR